MIDNLFEIKLDQSSKTFTIDQVLSINLTKFYKIPSNLNALIDIVIDKSSKIKLDLLEWVIIKYAKTNNIEYKIRRPDGIIHKFNIYDSYKNQLKHYGKKKFDPFCRGDKINILYKTDDNYYNCETAIRQLLFFRWAIENLILIYINDNYDSLVNLKKQKPKINDDKTDMQIQI
jgi:hypothetical protein